MSLTYSIQFIIQSVDQQDLKLNLLWRPEAPYQWAIFSLFISIILLTITRINNPLFVVSLFRSIYKNRNIEKIVFEELPLSRITNFCLVSNFRLSVKLISFRRRSLP